MAKGRNTTVLTVRVRDELASKIKQQARQRGILVNDYLKQILEANWKLPDTKEDITERKHEEEQIKPRRRYPIEDERDGITAANIPAYQSAFTKRETYPGTPRNAPCPCGSGLKYKRCHGA